MKSFSRTGIQIGIVTALILTLSSTSTFASTTQYSSSFAPQNDRSIPVGSHLAGGIDEATFNAVIDSMLKVWTPIVKAAGGTLSFNRLWSDATVNSSANQSGKKWVVNAYGGLARHPLMTKDAMMMVFCHEMGHHLGGYPKEPGIFGSSWASNEGQADYFATMKCFRRMTQEDDNSSVISTLSVPQEVKAKCSLLLKDTKDIALCQRSSLVGETLADVLWDLANSGGKIGHAKEAKPAFNTPDPTVVTKTNNDHPASQCRLDTYFNGSICGISYTQDFAKDNPTTGACAMEKGDKDGFRPLCWYKPKN